MMGEFSFLRVHHFPYLPTLVTELNERMFVLSAIMQLAYGVYIVPEALTGRTPFSMN